MKLYTVKSNGQTFTFHVLKDTTQPCPQCGVPACGEEDILWYEEDGKRIALMYDGSYFNLAVQEFFEKNWDALNYDKLPDFMKEANESRGWQDCDDYTGYVLDIDDFLNSLVLLKTCAMGKWITEEDIADLQGIALQARDKGKELKIVNG